MTNTPLSHPSSIRWCGLAIVLLVIAACTMGGGPKSNETAATKVELPAPTSDLGTRGHLDRVMTSASCSECHPAIYAEHKQNTHARAFLDVETRLATRNFRREDCIRCHTPRPEFETGIGMTPMQRWTNLEEGNTCMSCHWKQDYDYSRFEGGKECKTAFDPRVGMVQACAACHRIAGTPDQWSRAEHGKKEGNLCIDCHMPMVERPVAIGEPARLVRSHVFPASHSETQLRRACGWDARIEGNEVVVTIKNKGAGHNFPTATRQRALESLVTVKDKEGKVIGSSRLVCRYPYASELEPGQLTMPTGSQIPSGKSREHRVPLPVEAGSVECSLFFKIYRPSDDYDPELSRQLEHQVIPFDGVTPSTKEIKDAIEPPAPPPPQADIHEFFDPMGLCNVARPAPKPGPIDIPEGKTPEEIERLVSMLEFHMPTARKLASEKLRTLGPAAYPWLIKGLGTWSNETFNQSMAILASIGEPALPAVRQALKSPELYVRCHARLVIARMQIPTVDRGVLDDVAAGLRMPNALDRRSAAEALGQIGDDASVKVLRPMVDDPDWDVVIASAEALSALRDRDSVPALERVFASATMPEVRRRVGVALGELGSAAGIPALIDGLEDQDELMREIYFENVFALTGLHFAYDPGLDLEQRLVSISHLRAHWAAHGGNDALRTRRRIDPRVREHALELVIQLGGGSDTEAGGDDRAIMAELVHMAEDAEPALIEALTYPSGYVQKRELACEALARIGGQDTTPFLAMALRDPALSVSEAACNALEVAQDPEVLPALKRYEARLRAVAAESGKPGSMDVPLAQAARVELKLGYEKARDTLVALLSSPDENAREAAIRALEAQYGDRRGFDPRAESQKRADAIKLWLE